MHLIIKRKSIINVLIKKLSYILEQISNASVLNFKYFNSDISYFSYVSVLGYEISFRRKEILNSCYVTSSDEIS